MAGTRAVALAGVAGFGLFGFGLSLGSAGAEPLFFTDEAAFLEAVRAATLELEIESFESAPEASVAPIVLDDVTVTTLAGILVEARPRQNEHDGCVTDGDMCIGWFESGEGDVLLRLHRPVHAVAIDLVGLGSPPAGATSLRLETSTGSQVLFQDFQGSSTTVSFGGVVDASTEFVFATLSSTNPRDFIGLDRLQIGFVPEAPAALLRALALLSVLATSRLRPC